MKTMRELEGMAVNRMRLTVGLRPSGFYFEDETIAAIRDAFEKFVLDLPTETSEMSISYLQDNRSIE